MESPGYVVFVPLNGSRTRLRRPKGGPTQGTPEKDVMAERHFNPRAMMEKAIAVMQQSVPESRADGKARRSEQKR
jgi:hypothetical protein